MNSPLFLPVFQLALAHADDRFGLIRYLLTKSLSAIAMQRLPVGAGRRV
jgi:hypothetical protein